jgi:2-C-methyl-D-erythritol 4-phosphate cytidylyltransferase
MEVGVIVAATGCATRRGAACMAGMVELFCSLDEVCRIVAVGPAGRLDLIRGEAVRSGKPLAVCAGGDTWQHPVRAGLQALGPCEHVLVQDAARPLAPAALIRRVLQAAVQSGAAIPALPPRDPVLRVGGGRITESLDPSQLMLAQAPQGFRYQLLERAHFEAADAGLEGDDAQLVVAAGHEVAVVEGEPEASCSR